MKKSARKLSLHRETIVHLETMAKVAAGVTTLPYTERQKTFTQEPGGLTAFPCDVPVVTYPWC
jgi:hypothetical protein